MTPVGYLGVRTGRREERKSSRRTQRHQKNSVTLHWEQQRNILFHKAAEARRAALQQKPGLREFLPPAEDLLKTSDPIESGKLLRNYLH